LKHYLKYYCPVLFQDNPVIWLRANFFFFFLFSFAFAPFSNGFGQDAGKKSTFPGEIALNITINKVSSNLYSGSGVFDNGRISIPAGGGVSPNGFMESSAATGKNVFILLGLAITNPSCGNNNGSITAMGSNGTAPYQYSIDGANFQTNNVFGGLGAGNYTITIRDAAGLTSVNETTLINVPGPQIQLALSQASCTNTNGSITINATGGTAPLQYSIDNGSLFQANNLFTDLDSGQYIAMVQDANGCNIRDTVQLTALPTPVFSLGHDTSVCSGQSLLLSAPQGAGSEYRWQDNSTGGNYTATTSGAYWLMVTNQFGCSGSDTIEIIFKPLPAFSIGDDTGICRGQAFSLQPNVVILQATYLWSTGAVSESLQINLPGFYWLQVSNGGCAKTDSILISYKPNPVLNLGNDTTLCTGQTLLLNAENPNAFYSWQDGSANPTYTVEKAGLYQVKVSENGCDTTGQVNISYDGKPQLSLGADTTLCFTEQLVLNASYPEASYTWQDGTSLPSYTVSQAGTYSVAVTNLCGTTLDSVIVSYQDCACKFYIPSAFSPNHDGHNDIFLPRYQCLFSDYELKIFNRWGQLLFNSGNPSNGWDGNFGSQPQPTGTYVWELEYKDNLTGKLMRKNGTLVLIR
jgi:gliding motility-associated-like protein